MPNVASLKDGYNLFEDDHSGSFYIVDSSGSGVLALPDHWLWRNNPSQQPTVDLLNWIIDNVVNAPQPERGLLERLVEALEGLNG